MKDVCLDLHPRHALSVLIFCLVVLCIVDLATFGVLAGSEDGRCGPVPRNCVPITLTNAIKHSLPDSFLRFVVLTENTKATVYHVGVAIADAHTWSTGLGSMDVVVLGAHGRGDSVWAAGGGALVSVVQRRGRLGVPALPQA